MKISKIRIKNYRSIRSEVAIDYADRLVIVGPNNSGKTNILEAIHLFFSPEPDRIYSIKDDVPFDSEGELTSIIVQFSGFSGSSNVLHSRYGELLKFLEGGPPLTDDILVYLVFSPLGKSGYRFHTNYKIKSDQRDRYKELHDALISDFRNYFSCKYIQSEKSAADLYMKLLLPHLKYHVGGLLQDQEKKVIDCLEDVSRAVGDNLKACGIENISCHFSLPDNLFASALSKFDFFINDGKKTQSLRKGAGIQAATTLACFKWITEQERKNGKEVVWLIEEPESYLHPGLYDSCSRIIEKLSEISSVIATTHAIGFVPQNPKRTVSTSMSDQGTVCSSFETYAQATSSIRHALGLRFSDFYNLGRYNLFVEGKTDKAIIEWALKLIQPKGVKNSLEALRQANIIDFGGVSKLKEFLKSTYEFMCNERAIVVLLDGDEASTKATADLRNYFNGKLKFRSNHEYFLLPNRLPIEAVFPEEWLEDLSRTHEGWIGIERDINKNLVSLRIDDAKKMNIANWLMRRGDEYAKKNGHYSWASTFITVLNSLNDGLLEIDKNIIKN